MSKETTSKKKTKRRLASFFGKIVIYILILILIAGIPFAYQFGHSIFYGSSVDIPPGRNVGVSIDENTSIGQLADILYGDGIIENKFSFEIQAKFFDIRMHTGDYIFNSSQTSREILEMIDEGASESNYNDNKS